MKKVCSIIVADTPCESGRTYTREAMEKAIEEFNSRGQTYISCNFDHPKQRMSDIIGSMKYLHLMPNGMMAAELQPIPCIPGVNYSLLFDICEFSPMATGKEGPDGKIEDLRFEYFALTPKLK